MFETLESTATNRRRKVASFFCAFSIQIGIIAFVILVGIVFPQVLPAPERHYALSWIEAMEPPPKPVVKITRREAPPPSFVPKVRPPSALELPPPPTIKPVAPKTPPVTAAVNVPAPPAPPAPAPAAPLKEFNSSGPDDKPKQQASVQTGMFGGAPEAVTTRRALSQVQTGGFGSPEGLPGKAMGGSAGNVPKLGLFGLPEGPGYGNGTGGSHGVRGVIASSGFGSGIASMGTSRTGPPVSVATGNFATGVGESHGGPVAKVATGGFQTAAPAAPTKTVQVEAPPVDFQPVEIISKPTPVYTEEARRLKIEGEVALSVIFLANGTIKVLGVVKSLGHGLDQVAEQSAPLIRFKPALRDGKPTDFPATLRIQFRLAE